MEKGRIIKIISNQYTIANEDKTVIAKPRGKLRLSTAPLVGDEVLFDDSQDTVVISKILPRTNRLLRPAVVNVDQALIVTSAKEPDYSPRLLNRLIFLVLLAGIKPVICLTKSDLLSESEKEYVDAQMELYKKAGYAIFVSHPGSDDAALQELLKGKISVLCGQSGAGKSSLLNRLDPTFQLQTQQISKALGRGKHTTRHCQLHPVAGGLVADTPGFSSLDFTRLDLEHLADAIPDFSAALEKGCRFADCRHLDEPGCAVKEEVQAGNINPELYEDYSVIAREYYTRKKKY
jgi:ribosome biogenesis GTPase